MSLTRNASGFKKVGIGSAAMLLSLAMTACQMMNLSFGERQSGLGVVAAVSCDRTDSDSIWINQIASSTGGVVRGPGANGCSPPDTGIFGFSKQLGYAADGQQLPEWVDITYGTFRKTYSHKEFNDRYQHPNVTQRVYLRKLVPQSIIEEVKAATRKQLPGKLPDLALYLYFQVFNDDIKVTWAMRHPEKWEPVKYGGYVPKNMDQKILERFEKAHSQYIEPDAQ